MCTWYRATDSCTGDSIIALEIHFLLSWQKQDLQKSKFKVNEIKSNKTNKSSPALLNYCDYSVEFRYSYIHSFIQIGYFGTESDNNHYYMPDFLLYLPSL